MADTVQVDRKNLEALLDLAEAQLVQIEGEWGAPASYGQLVKEGDGDAAVIERVRASMRSASEEGDTQAE